MMRRHSIAIIVALVSFPSRADAALDIEAWRITTEPQPVPGDTEMLGPPRLDLRGFPLSSGGARRCDGTIGFHISHLPTGVFFLDTAVWPSRPKDPDRPGLSDDYADQFSQPGSRDMGCGQSAVCQFVPVLSFMQEGPQGYELAEPPFDPAVSVIRVTWADDRLTDEVFHYEDVGRPQSYFFSEESFAYIVYDADASSVTLHTAGGETEFSAGADAPRIWPRHTWFPHEIREFNGTNRPRVTTITYVDDEFPTEASREDELLWRIDWSEDHVAAITGPDSAYRFDLVYQESTHGRKQLVAQVFDDVGVRFGYNRDARPVTAQLWRNEDGAPKGPSHHAVKVDLDANGMVTKMTTPQFTESATVQYSEGIFTIAPSTGATPHAATHQVECEGDTLVSVSSKVGEQLLQKTSFEWNKWLDSATRMTSSDMVGKNERRLTLDASTYPASVFPREGVPRRTVLRVEDGEHDMTVGITEAKDQNDLGVPREMWRQNKRVSRTTPTSNGQPEKIETFGLDGGVAAIETFTYVTPQGYGGLEVWEQKLRPLATYHRKVGEIWMQIELVWDPEKPWWLSEVVVTGVLVPGKQRYRIDREGGSISFKEIVTKVEGVPELPSEIEVSAEMLRTKVGSNGVAEQTSTFDPTTGQLKGVVTGLGSSMEIDRAGLLQQAQSIVGKSGVTALSLRVDAPVDEYGIPQGQVRETLSGAGQALSFGLENLSVDHPPHGEAPELTIPPNVPASTCEPEACPGTVDWHWGFCDFACECQPACLCVQPDPFGGPCLLWSDQWSCPGEPNPVNCF